MTQQITVFGANGHVGSRVVGLLLERGYDVRASVRSKSKLQPHPKLTIITGDIYNRTDVMHAIDGSRAIICALGSWKTAKKDVVSSATEYIIPAMNIQNINRFISVTGAEANAPGDEKSIIHKLSHSLFLRLARPIMIDSEKHLRLLNESDVDWTTIRSPTMVKTKSMRYKLSNSRPLPVGIISYTAVAQAVVDQIEDNIWLQKAPYIH